VCCCVRRPQCSPLSHSDDDETVINEKLVMTGERPLASGRLKRHLATDCHTSVCVSLSSSLPHAWLAGK